MAKHRRSAKYECMLLYVDEPQLISLVANKARFVALAVPPADEQRFVVTTVSKRDWASYLRGSIDLRYLFTVPEMRQTYTFDLSSMKEGKVMMDPRTEPLTEDLLPSPRFFAENHTERRFTRGCRAINHRWRMGTTGVWSVSTKVCGHLCVLQRDKMLVRPRHIRR